MFIDDFDTQIHSDEADLAEMYGEIVPPTEEEVDEMFRFFHICAEEV